MAVRVLAQYSIVGREPGLIRGTLPDMVRSLLLASLSGVCAALALIPAVGIAFVIIGALVSWIGFASAAINSALMVTGVGLRDRLRFIMRSFSAMAGIGAVVFAALFVPFAGLLALPAAVIGATDLYARMLKS
jgi:uncharacterized protein involved in cysteine biosynthesis